MTDAGPDIDWLFRQARVSEAHLRSLDPSLLSPIARELLANRDMLANEAPANYGDEWDPVDGASTATRPCGTVVSLDDYRRLRS